jgi:ribonuclease P protein component
LIDELFRNGKSVSAFPIKGLFAFSEDAHSPLQAGVAVSSRSFKKAVERNRVKRVLREVYRLQKLPLQQVLERSGQKLVIFFIYTGKELPVFRKFVKRWRYFCKS